MNIQNFICTELGLYSPEFIDAFEKDWEIDTDSIDYRKLIQTAVYTGWQLESTILYEYIYQIKARAVKEYGIDEDDIDYYVNGSLDTSVYYKDEEYYTWHDLEEKLKEETNGI